MAGRDFDTAVAVGQISRQELREFFGEGHYWKLRRGFGGPERVRTVDLFHAMEARSQLRHRPTLSGHL